MKQWVKNVVYTYILFKESVIYVVKTTFKLKNKINEQKIEHWKHSYYTII